jgi:hypothetical protein
LTRIAHDARDIKESDMSRALVIALVGILLSPTAVWAADETVAPAMSTTRPALLMPLYAGNIALQGFDAYSTLAAVQKNSVEQNPLVSGLAGSPAAFIAVKGGVTVLSIVAAERLWRSGHRAGAVAAIAVANGLMTAVAINNANTLRRMR